MDNFRFLKKILTTSDEYWIVAKKQTAARMGSMIRIEDDIVLISIPQSVKRPKSEVDILVKEVETLERLNIDTNIYLSQNYPPFQLGFSFYDVYDGFPVEMSRDKLAEALLIQSSDLHDYRKFEANPKPIGEAYR